MKTKTIITHVYVFVLCTTASMKTFAQQPVQSKLLATQQMHFGQTPANLSAKIFMAPDKTYGYDILNDGKLVYHQPAFSKNPREDNISITKKEQANTAALVAIQKIRNGENPQLSTEELQKIITH